MSKDEALKDAVQQFQSQGVSLQYLDLTGGEGREEVMKALDLIKDESSSHETLHQALTDLRSFCDESCSLHPRNINLVATTGTMYNLMEKILNREDAPDDLLQSVLKTLIMLCKRSIECRDYFEPGGSNILVNRLKHLCQDEIIDQGGPSLIHSCLLLTRTVIKTENTKCEMMRQGISILLMNLLAKPRTVDTAWSAVLYEACMVIRGLCIHDDMRKEMSCAYDNGKVFLTGESTEGSNKEKCFKMLLSFAKLFKEHTEMAAAGLAAGRQLITSEESVKVATQYGAMELPMQILQWDEAPLPLLRSVCGMMRNMCADDARKNKLVTDGTLVSLVAALSTEKCLVDAVFCEHAIGTIAQMTLRSPANSNKICETGFIEILMKCMRIHADKGAMQRQACLTIRNIAGRCQDLKGTLLDAGAEPLLRAAGRLQGSVDEAYGALRDLECEVQMVKINAEGQVESVFEQFGSTKSSFKAVYDEAPDIEKRIEEDSRAPFAAGGIFDRNSATYDPDLEGL